MGENKTLDTLVRKAERLRIVNKYSLILQLPEAIFTRTPSGLENYLNSKIVAMAVLGAVLITETAAGIKLHREKDKHLIDTGIYGIVRNPIYLGFRLTSLGTIIYNPSVENLVAGGVLLLTTELTARAEERKLEHIYPAEYPQYKEKVSRWIPFGTQIRQNISNFIDYYRTKFVGKSSRIN